jgi:hypothetical protein
MIYTGCIEKYMRDVNFLRRVGASKYGYLLSELKGKAAAGRKDFLHWLEGSIQALASCKPGMNDAYMESVVNFAIKNNFIWDVAALLPSDKPHLSCLFLKVLSARRKEIDSAVSVGDKNLDFDDRIEVEAKIIAQPLSDIEEAIADSTENDMNGSYRIHIMSRIKRLRIELQRIGFHPVEKIDSWTHETTYDSSIHEHAYKDEPKPGEPVKVITLGLKAGKTNIKATIRKEKER